MRIAVVEDNIALANGIAHQLRDKGHAVNILHGGAQALTFVQQDDVDLIILDINLPEMDGFHVIKALRDDKNQTPILILTARGDLQDRLKGLDAGADDYMIKPFEMEELEARVRVLLRRSPSNMPDTSPFGTLDFDRAGRILMADGQDIGLPRRELAAFECLMDRTGTIVSKTQLVEYLYGVGADVEDQVVEVYVSRLRKKLGPYGIEIKTARGLGYMMDLKR